MIHATQWPDVLDDQNTIYTVEAPQVAIPAFHPRRLTPGTIFRVPMHGPVGTYRCGRLLTAWDDDDESTSLEVFLARHELVGASIRPIWNESDGGTLLDSVLQHLGLTSDRPRPD